MKNAGTLFLSLVVFISLMWPSLLIALDFPRGPVILTFRGMISRSNLSGEALLDAAMLKSLPQHEIITDTPWTDGQVKFEGPLLRDVLKLVGAKPGSMLNAIAINDYFVSIPTKDAESHDVILAMKMNDQDLTVRTKGPVWVIYPWSRDTSLRSETYYSRSIWQLRSISVQ